jgi:class 3 adenylate cyclase
MERKLAAILAADVVGYSHLMEADEAGTLGDPQSQAEVFQLLGSGPLNPKASALVLRRTSLCKFR